MAACVGRWERKLAKRPNSNYLCDTLAISGIRGHNTGPLLLRPLQHPSCTQRIDSHCLQSVEACFTAISATLWKPAGVAKLWQTPIPEAHEGDRQIASIPY